jgi:hypothetical protein
LGFLAFNCHPCQPFASEKFFLRAQSVRKPADVGCMISAALASEQLSDVGRNPSRLVARQQLGCRSSAQLILEIDISERLPAVFAHNKTSGLFFDRGGNLRAATLCSAGYQSQNEQQDNRADEGVDDCGNDPAADYDADLWQQPAGDQGADNADDNITDQPVAAAFDRHTGQPTGDGANDQPNDQCLCVHLSPHFSSPSKGHPLVT